MTTRALNEHIDHDPDLDCLEGDSIDLVDLVTLLGTLDYMVAMCVAVCG